MSFSWGEEVEQRNGNLSEMFAALAFEDVFPGQQPGAGAKQEKRQVDNSKAEDDENNNNNNNDDEIQEEEQETNFPSVIPRQGVESASTLQEKGKEEEAEEEDDSYSEEIMLVNCGAPAPHMRMPQEIHAACLSWWDDLYPENTPVKYAPGFEDQQLDWDASWYRDKIESVLSKPHWIQDGKGILLPCGLVKNYAIALEGKFERDAEVHKQALMREYTDYLRATIAEAWTVAALDVTGSYFEFAQVCGAIDRSHAEELQNMLLAQRKHINEFNKRLQAELKEKKFTPEEEREMVAKLRADHTLSHPFVSREAEARPIDAVVLHELVTIDKKSKTSGKSKVIAFSGTYTLGEPMQQFIEEKQCKEIQRQKKARKRRERRRRKRAQKSGATGEKDTSIEEPVAQQTTNEPLAVVKARIMLCAFGGFKRKTPEWKVAKRAAINTTGVHCTGEDGSFAYSTTDGVVVCSIPAGEKLAEYKFPGNWHGNLRRMFIDKQLLCCVFSPTAPDGSRALCQAVVFDRLSQKAKVLAVPTQGSITAMCSEPSVARSFWVGFANGSAYCFNWESATFEIAVSAVNVLATVAPVTKLSRSGRMLYCHCISGVSVLDVQPLKGESIEQMHNRAGNPDFYRYSLISDVGRRGTILAILQRDHNLAITHATKSGLVKVLVPPERLCRTELREYTVPSEDGKGEIIEERETPVPIVTQFPLTQHARVDDDKIVILYSDASVRVLHTRPKTNKERLKEAVQDLMGKPNEEEIEEEEMEQEKKE